MSEDVARYGIVGFGRIGQRIAERFSGPDAPELAAILVRPSQMEAARQRHHRATICANPGEFLATAPDVAVECASPAALAEFGPQLLAAGIDVVPISLVAFTDPLAEQSLRMAAARGPGRIELAAGAMAALDFLATAREHALSAVTFRARNPPWRWRGDALRDRINIASNEEGTKMFFRGTVREAARLFPRNLNVSVGVALAGLGLDATVAELFVDPALRQAVLEVEAVAASGAITLRVGPSTAEGDDPVDHTTFSVMRVLRRRGARVAI